MFRTDRLFPDGIYNQNVQLVIKNKPGANFPFQTLSKVANGNYEVIGFNPFGGKAFEAKGILDSPDTTQIKFFMKVPEIINEAFIKKTLDTIQQLQKVKKSQLTKESDHHFYQKSDFTLQIFKFTSQGIPSVLKLSTTKWESFIRLNNYKKIEIRDSSQKR